MDEKPDDPMTEAISAAMFLCPMEVDAAGKVGRAVLSADEGAAMVRAAIAVYLHEQALQVGNVVGYCGHNVDREEA